MLDYESQRDSLPPANMAMCYSCERKLDKIREKGTREEQMALI